MISVFARQELGPAVQPSTDPQTLPNRKIKGYSQAMALTLEDLDRRVAALEKAAGSEKNVVRAVAEMVDESEKRVRAEMSELRAEMSGLRVEMKAETHRLTDVVSAAERRMVDTLNDRFDKVMVALDRLK
jgi:hypothetical protein